MDAGVPYKAHRPPSAGRCGILQSTPLKESDVPVGTLAPHGRVALIPNCHTPDRLRRSKILSALGLATFSQALTVFVSGSSRRNFPGWSPILGLLQPPTRLTLEFLQLRSQ
ncbi:hypothetical protein L3X38_039046 [Prunus dulcis]|uniref:Uncharacterized protein n=1 Tax=Prunus dulcis TaxID=3755 RepID=A0AAD4V6P8_PRUDU|nr:hypothetical protein L3X38_039046 [Prunus dulcis]